MSCHEKSLSDTDLEIAEITESASSINVRDLGIPKHEEPIIRISRGRGKWSAKIREEEQQQLFGNSNGHGFSKLNDYNNHCPVNYNPQKIARNRYPQFEDNQENNTPVRQKHEKLGLVAKEEESNHKVRRASQEHATSDKVKEMPPKEVYVPEEELKGDALFEHRKSKRYRTGLNFDAYEHIPCEVHGDRKQMFKIKTFEDLDLKPVILHNILKMEYEKPTPIQKHATPHMMKGIDIMACAQTGSGKTAGFLLPIINALLDKDLRFRGEEAALPFCLVLAPTRELAKQIYTEASMYSNDTGIVNCCVYGGVAMFHQKGVLKRGCHILVATPGRLLQFVEENYISLEKVKYFVLDEADRMLDMGFMPDVRRIVKQLPPKGERVSAMFSATFPTAIQKAAAEYLENYVFVAIGTVGGACSDIQQIIYNVARAEKRRKLKEVFSDVLENEKVLIFCGKKQSADFLAAHLATLQISTTSIHGDRLQSQRELALQEFTDGVRQVLVATSVASRGLDIPKVSYVINYDLPDNIDDYVHRIGRTGRVGHVGKSISFYDQSFDAALAPQLVRILRNANQEVPDWLVQQSEPDDNRFAGQRRFGATDHRIKNRNFTGVQSVPDPVEVDEDDWGQ